MIGQQNQDCKEQNEGVMDLLFRSLHGFYIDFAEMVRKSWNSVS